MKAVASLGALFILAACPGERAVLNDGEPSPLATDDAAYLVQLGLMRGHLRVGHACWKLVPAPPQPPIRSTRRTNSTPIWKLHSKLAAKPASLPS